MEESEAVAVVPELPAEADSVETTARRRGRHSPKFAKAVANAEAVAYGGNASALAVANAFAGSLRGSGYRAPCVSIAIANAYAVAIGGNAQAVAIAVAETSC